MIPKTTATRSVLKRFQVSLQKPVGFRRSDWDSSRAPKLFYDAFDTTAIVHLITQSWIDYRIHEIGEEIAENEEQRVNDRCPHDHGVVVVRDSGNGQ